jgi:hypothetical protein
MPQSEHDRREDTRKPAPVELYVEYPDYQPRIRDLSPNGAFIEDARPLKPGRVVRILITDRKNPPLEMQAMVRRVIPDQGMTVEFVGMSDETRRRLRALVDVEIKTEEKLR